MNVTGIARKTVVAGFLVATLLPVVAFMTLYSRIYMPGLESAVNPNAFPPRTDRDLLASSRWGWYRVIDFVNRFLPADALVLVFRQNDFVFYGKRRVIRDVDPRMIPIYQQPGKEEAYRALVKLGVGFFYLPEYSVPTEYNTPVGAVLADPELVRLVFDQRGTRLYRLVPPSERRPLATGVVLGGVNDWVLYEGAHQPRPVKLPYRHEWRSAGAGTIWLQSGEGPWQLSPAPSIERPPIVPGSTLQLRSRIMGDGWLTVYIIDYLKRSAGQLAVRALHRGALTREQPFDLDLQVRTDPSAAGFRFLIAFEGEGRFAIGPIHVVQIAERLPYGLEALGRDADESNRGLGVGSVLRSEGDGPARRFTGPGHYLVPPSVYGVEPPPMEFGDVTLYRVRLEISGKGDALLSAVSYDVDGVPRATALETIALSPETAVIERVLILPPGTREFRFGVIPTGRSERVLLDWAKRIFWRERPPSVHSYGSVVAVRKFSATHAPNALKDPGLRDCILRNSKGGTTHVPSLCQP